MPHRPLRLQRLLRGKGCLCTEGGWVMPLAAPPGPLRSQHHHAVGRSSRSRHDRRRRPAAAAAAAARRSARRRDARRPPLGSILPYKARHMQLRTEDQSQKSSRIGTTEFRVGAFDLHTCSGALHAPYIRQSCPCHRLFRQSSARGPNLARGPRIWPRSTVAGAFPQANRRRRLRVCSESKMREEHLARVRTVLS